MKYLVDTDGLIDVLSGVAAASSTLQRLSPSGIGLSIVTIGELYEGAVLSSDSRIVLERYRAFLGPFPALPITETVMVRFATIRAHLRQNGNLIPDFDLVIAATALERRLVLITRNLRHYQRIPNLQLFSAD